MPKIRLNLGCCDNHVEGYCNVDRVEPADVVTDLEKDWPWLTDSVEMIVATDIFEHLSDKIHTMNEAWRVLQPGGVLQLLIPTTDGRGAFQDPTHRSFWTPNDLLYYTDGKEERDRFAKHYGITACFNVAESRHFEMFHKVWYLAAILEAIK
jgi:SAM-dependent methyltransferase